MSKKRTPIYVFNLKSTITDKIFLHWFRKKLNTKRYQIICRGRHPDRKALYAKRGWKYTKYGQNEVPLRDAKTIGVYLNDKIRDQQ